MSALWNRNTDGGTRPTMFDVPGSSAQRGHRRRGAPAGRISTSTSSADRFSDATRCGAPRPRAGSGSAASSTSGRGQRAPDHDARREQVREDEAVALHDVAAAHRHRRAEHGTVPGEAVELARSRRRDRRPPAGRRSKRASKARPAKAAGSTRGSTQVSVARWPARDHLARQRRGGAAPEREQRDEAGARHPLLAVAADVLEEEVAKGDRLDPVRARRGEGVAPWPLRRPRWGTATGWARSCSGRPTASACASSSVRRTACMATRSCVCVHRGEQADHLHVLPAPEDVEGPGAVLAAAPGQERPSCHGCPCGSAAPRAPSGRGPGSRGLPGTRGRAGSRPPRRPRSRAPSAHPRPRVEARVASFSLRPSPEKSLSARSPDQRPAWRPRPPATAPPRTENEAWCFGRRSSGCADRVDGVEVGGARQDLAVEAACSRARIRTRAGGAASSESSSPCARVSAEVHVGALEGVEVHHGEGDLVAGTRGGSTSPPRAGGRPGAAARRRRRRCGCAPASGPGCPGRRTRSPKVSKKFGSLIPAPALARRVVASTPPRSAHRHRRPGHDLRAEAVVVLDPSAERHVDAVADHHAVLQRRSRRWCARARAARPAREPSSPRLVLHVGAARSAGAAARPGPRPGTRASSGRCRSGSRGDR